MGQMGLWSLLVAFGSLGRVMDVSGSGALGRFVAITQRDEGHDKQRKTVDTVLLTSLGINLCLGMAMYFLAPVILPFVLETNDLQLAFSLVPWVIASFVLSAVANGISGGIDGMQRADQRALVVSFAAIIFLLSAWLMVPRLGLVGFALAQVIQQLTIMGVGWLLLRHHIPSLGWLPVVWCKETFRSTSLYSVKLNAIGVMGILFEPLAKVAFNHAGGTVAVAVYELASRMVTQVRALVIAAALPLVPAMAATSGPDDLHFRGLLTRAVRSMGWAALLVYTSFSCRCANHVVGRPWNLIRGDAENECNPDARVECKYLCATTLSCRSGVRYLALELCVACCYSIGADSFYAGASACIVNNRRCFWCGSRVDDQYIYYSDWQCVKL